MSNMSYVMFENTLSDLQDCIAKLEEISWNTILLSQSERVAAHRLIELCKDVAESVDS